jgi:hypothetical protein
MSDQFIRFVGKALVPALVFLVFALARKYMSVTSVKAPEHVYSQEDLSIRFRYTQWIVGLYMLVLAVLFALSTHAVLVWLNRYLATADGPSDFRQWPQSAIWWFFPGFGAVSLCWEMTLQLWSRFGNREKADLYAYWTNQSVGFDSRRVLRWMAVLIAAPIGVLTVLALSMHTSLRDHDIRDCGYAFAPCKTYRYDAANRLTMIEGFRTRDGKLSRRAGIVIDFNDGRRWSSAKMNEFDQIVDPSMTEFLEHKTQLGLNYADTEADLPSAGYSSH